jgi:hypothetical protein
MPPKKYKDVEGCEGPTIEERIFSFFNKVMFIALKFVVLHKLVFKSYNLIFGSNSDEMLANQGDDFAEQI